MSDPYLLLTPLLAFLVIALVRFVGCSEALGIEDWRLQFEPPPAPGELTVQYGNETVTLSWLASAGAEAYRVKRSDTSMGSTVESVETPKLTIALPHPYATTRFYIVHALKTHPETHESVEGPSSNEVSATGSRPLLAVITNFGTPRNDFSGRLGMQITIGPNPLRVVALGRVSHIKHPPAADAPMAHDHTVRIAGPVTPQPQPDPLPNDLASAEDLPEGVAVVSPGNGVVAGDFVYETLKTAVDLAANATYIIVSKEVAQSVNPTMDEWHDYDQPAVANPDAVLDRAVYQQGTATVYTLPKNGVGALYVPVNALYHPM